MKYEKNGYTEENGIIYPSSVTGPPQFGDGLASLYQYLEDNVKVFPTDDEGNLDEETEFPFDGETVFLFEIKMDTLGKITAIDLSEASSSSQGKGFQAGHLSDEIKKTLDAMPAWQPAEINGKAAAITFYLPLNLRVELNKIILFQSKYLVPYHNRKNKN